MSFCSHHPTRPAQYHCPKCATYYCRDCIDTRSQKPLGAVNTKTLYFCPKCNLQAQSLGVGSFIPPFWQRLPKFFAYPLQPRPLILMLVLTAANVLFSWIPLMSLVFWAILVRYSFVVLRNTMHGDLRPPDISSDVIFQGLGEALKQIVLFLIVIVSAVIVFKEFGITIGLAYLPFVIMLMPAMVIVLVISNSLISSLNPVAFVTIAYRIGWGYLLMYLFLIMLLAAPTAIAFSIVPYLPDLVSKLMFVFAQQYYTVITYNLMGYVMLQYHYEIGYEVTADEFQDQKPMMKDTLATSEYEEEQIDPNQALLNQINILIQDGRPDDAIQLVRNRTRGPVTDRTLSERYYNLLKITQRHPEMLTHALSYLDLLAGGEERKPACEVYRECISVDARFTPNPDTLYRIADWSVEDGDVKGGVNAFVKFINANPTHVLAAKAHLVVARALHERLNQTGKARQVLERLLVKYPDHDLAGHARRYLGELPSEQAPESA